MYRQKELQTVDENELDTDQRENFNIGAQYANHRQEIVDKLTETQQVWMDVQVALTCPKMHRNDHTGRTPHELCLLRRWTKSTRTREDGNKQNAPHKRYCAFTGRVGNADRICVAPKKDGSLCFCFDYRTLNVLTAKDVYPILQMDECLKSLDEARILQTLHANCRYFQIQIDEQDEDKTAFKSHHGLYRILRILFGLKNASTTFQRAMDSKLSTAKWQLALVYLDDVVIFLRSIEQHLDHKRSVLELLSTACI